MKKTLTIILLLTCSILFSQDITGKWKVIIYEDDVAYYNQKTDSISYKTSTKSEYSENFKNENESYFSTVLEFDKNKNYIIDTGGKKGKAKYEIDSKNGKIKFIWPNGNTETRNFKYENQILTIEIDLYKLGMMRF